MASKVSSSVARTINAIPKGMSAEFSYKPQCETCVANTYCMGCSFPACTYCYESRCDHKRSQNDPQFTNDCKCIVRCKSRINLGWWLTQSEGLLPGPIHLENYKSLALPKVMPIIKTFWSEATGDSPMALYPKWTYVIPINSFLRRDLTVPERIYRLRDFFPEGSQLILSFCVQDRFIEDIWRGAPSSKRSRGMTRGAFWKKEWFKQFDAAIGVNYSVYWADPQMEMHYAIRRTMMTTQEMDDNGINVIPLVIWYTDKEAWPQLDCYVKNGVDTVVINFQYVSGAQVASYEHDMRILHAIAKSYPHLRVICYGISAPYAINAARRILGPDRLCIITGHPYIDAIRAPVPELQKKEIFMGHLSKLTRIVKEGADPNRDFMRSSLDNMLSSLDGASSTAAAPVSEIG